MSFNPTMDFVSNKIDSNFLAEKLRPEELKIIIPTQDGKRISTFFRSSPFYKVLRVKKGKVKEFRVVRNGMKGGKKGASLKNPADSCICNDLVDCFCDCQVLIIRRIDHKSWDELGHMGVEIIQTDENDIDSSIQKYLDGTLRDRYNMR